MWRSDAEHTSDSLDLEPSSTVHHPLCHLTVWVLNRDIVLPKVGNWILGRCYNIYSFSVYKAQAYTHTHNMF